MTKTDETPTGTRNLLLAAAIEAFAELGYDGASTREIARRADSTQQLIGYHFGSKEDLWKAAADAVFGRAQERLVDALTETTTGTATFEPRARAETVIRAFIAVSAEAPELHQFVTQEAKHDGPRLVWILERWGQPFYDLIAEMFGDLGRRGDMASVHPVHLYFLLIGGCTVFANAPQVARLTGLDALGDDFVAAHTDLVVATLLGNPYENPDIDPSIHPEPKESTT
jgi:TetR/AcrR family transcriptional regulator